MRAVAKNHSVKLMQDAGTPDASDWTDPDKRAQFAEDMAHDLRVEKEELQQRHDRP